MMRSSLSSRVLAAACLLGACAALAQSPENLTRIRVGYSNVSGFTGLFVARSEGMFARRGLEVEPVLIALNSTMPSALVGGSLQIACPSPPVFLQAIEGGLDIVVIAGGTANDWSKASGQGVVARTGVAIKSARDFEGKRVGAPGIGSYMQVLFRRWLVTKGANDKKVQFVEVPFAQGSDILKTGNVDALLTSDPYYSRIIQAKTGYLVSHYLQEMPEGLFSLYYASNRDWAEQNPALVRAFRAALDEANAFVTREPVKARAILAAALKFPPDVAANIVITHLDTNVTQSDIKYWIDTLVDQGVLRTHPDPSRLLFN